MQRAIFLTVILLACLSADRTRAADAKGDDYAPHTPTLIFYLSNIADAKDADAIRTAVAKLPSVRKITVDAVRGFAQVRFDSHVVSYHQVAQAIADAGVALGKKLDPRLKIRVPEYAQAGNAAKVDAVFAGKRLNQRVTIQPLDKSKGEFAVHFLPLALDDAETEPQGFNGGHINHPIHDAPPRGLGLTCIYAADEDGAPAGFTPLFDGHSLAGWHTAPRLSVPKTAGEALADKPRGKSIQDDAKGRWEVRDGVILGGQDERRFIHREDGAEWGMGSWLMSDETFGDFELLVDAHPDWPCDTGIYVRSTALGQGFQILLDHRGDDTGGIGGSVGFLYLRGIGNFRVSPHNFRWTVGADGAPADVKLIPGSDGVTKMEFAATSEDFRRAWRMKDWNTFRIRVVGALPRITVWINDVKICECDTALIEHPDYQPTDVQKLIGARGHIAFEVHDGPPWRWGVGKVSRWRNIFIKPL